MARSQTSISNRALQIIGAQSISSIDDNTKNAREMKSAWTPLLEDLLEKHNWSFSIKRIELALLSTAPVFGFTSAFQLPLDYVRVVELDPKYTLYSIENGAILTNTSSLKMKYVSKITDPNTFTPEFAELLAFALAKETCYKITQSRAKESDLKSEWKARFAWASSNDSKAAGTPEKFADDIWIASRGYSPEYENQAYIDPTVDYGTI